MSTLTPADVRRRVTFPRVVASEWLKFRTLPSMWWTLAAATAAMVVLGGLIGSITGGEQTADPQDVTPAAMLRGYYVAQLLVGVLGVLFVSGEYSTGMIRATLTAVPRRVTVLAAKMLVFTSTGLLAMTVAAGAAFLASQALIDPAYAIGVGDDGVWQAVLATGVYLTVVGLLGAALGWVLRSTPAAISALVGLLLVAPVVLQVVSTGWSADAVRFLPSELGVALSSSVTPPGALGPGAATLGLVAWFAVALVAALVTLRRRDA